MPVRALSRYLEFAVPVALILFTWVGIAWHLVNEKEQFLNDAEQDSKTLAMAYAEHVELSIRAIDQALFFLRASYERDPSHFKIMEGKKNNYTLANMVVDVSIVDQNGHLLQTSLGDAPNWIDISDREDFRTHMNAADDKLFISKPTIGRVSNIWSLKFTRRLSAPDGRFNGVIGVSVRPSKLLEFFNANNPGPTAAIALMGLDGSFLARAPVRAGATEAAHPQPSGSVLTAAVQASESGTIQLVSSFDHIRRIVSFRHIGEYGVAVAVGLSIDEALAPYRRDRVMALGAGLGLTAIFGLAWMLAARQRQRLAQTRVALEATLENIRQGIVMVDAQGRVPVINRRAIELLGLPNHILGPKLTWSRILQWQLDTDDFRDGVTKGPPGGAITDFVRAGGIKTNWDSYERRRPTGQVLSIQTTQLPDGGAVRTYTDVTESRANEGALESARDAAEAANHGRAVFLAMMSHEIRTPMNGVIGMASLLLGTPLDDDQMRLARTVHESAEFLLEIIDDILTFSKLEANEIVLDESVFAPRDVMQSMTDSFALQARTKGIRLAWHVADAVPAHVCADVGRLRQVLFNLIGNAIKFTETGSVFIEVGVAAERGTHSDITWAIRDTGIGIDPIAQADLFREFWQADRTISRRFGGTGLGLAICRRLIERMGGTITVQSEVGHGSTFHFTVQMAHADAPLPQPRDVQAVDLSRSLSVLLAEDNLVNQMVAERVLQQLGHRVELVADGRAALLAAKSGSYDLILMDMMMPELDGIAATKAIRALPDRVAASVPILALTANAFPRDRELCLEAGMNGYISKPMRLNQLATAIAETMSHAGSPALPAAPAPATGGTFDCTIIEQLSGDVGAADAIAILDAFIEDAPKRLAQIDRATRAMDGLAMRQEMHTLKSAAASVGFMGLARLSGKLETEVAGLDRTHMLQASVRLNEQFSIELTAMSVWRAQASDT